VQDHLMSRAKWYEAKAMECAAVATSARPYFVREIYRPQQGCRCRIHPMIWCRGPPRLREIANKGKPLSGPGIRRSPYHFGKYNFHRLGSSRWAEHDHGRNLVSSPQGRTVRSISEGRARHPSKRAAAQERTCHRPTFTICSETMRVPACFSSQNTLGFRVLATGPA
jgi:hypothetical protein